MAVGVIDAFLNELRAAGVHLSLLHDGAAPGSDRWQGDVDMLVTSEREPAIRAIHDAASALGLGVVLEVPRVFNTLEVDLVFPGSSSWTIVCSDVRGTVVHVDAVFAADSRTRGGARGGQLDADTRFAYLALKRLRKGDGDAAKWRQMGATTVPTPAALRLFLGPRLASRVAYAAARGTPPDPRTLALARRVLHIRRGLTPRILRSLPRGAATAVGRLYRPSGVFVALGGADGSGKSAVTEALVEWSPFRHAARLHSRPEVLKPMGWYLGRGSSDGAEPHGSEPWGPGMSAVRLGYFWVDFAIGYWVRVWPVRARGGLVVSERWWWDMYVDPRRNRMQPMPRAARLLGRLIPRSDVQFVLDAPSEQIRQRKRELPADEIERQRASWDRLKPSLANVRTIDVARPLAEVNERVIEAVIERQGHRLGTSSPPLVAFPSTDPRWIVDPADRASMEAALRLYMPSRLGPRGVARGMAELHSRTPFGAAALRRLGTVPPDESGPVLEWIREAAARALPGGPVRLAAYLGSPGPLQKTIAVVLDASGRPAMYAKVGTTAGTAEALRHEARSLDLARSAVPSADVPVVRALETSELGVMLVLDALSGTRFPNRAATDGRHLRFVSELVGHSRTVDGSALRAALVDQLDRAADGPQTHFLRAAMERAEPIWSAIRSVHLAHGDFTPWNCLDRGARLGVVDWEMAGFRVAGWDVLRYPVQIESITRTGDVAGAADRVLAAPLVAEAGEVVTATAEVDMPDGESWPALQAAVLLEGAIELLADQPHLSRRGIAVRAHAAARLLGMAPPAAVS